MKENQPGLPAKENLMASASRLTELRYSSTSPVIAGDGDGLRAVCPHKGRPAVNPFRRFDRVAIGFWLGGVTLGTAGCILGACMPYRHPVAVTISVLWWGTYLGSFGASVGSFIGALLGARAEEKV
jgi:hypothetical protein